MREPSIKGTIFGPVADEVRMLIESKKVDEESAAVALEKRDFEYLDGKLNAASWFPIDTYARFLDLLCAAEGEGDPSYFERRGHASAKRLMDSGMYMQLDILESLAHRPGADDPACEEEITTRHRRKLAKVVSLTGTIYNVGEWKVIQDPEHTGRTAIEIRGAESYSDGMAGAIVGFFDYCATSVNEGIEKLYSFERPSPGVVLLRMNEDLLSLRRRSARP